MTPASDVFGGALRSEVRAQGAPPSATLEPCFVVHLDIHPETVHSVSDALSAFTSPETISGAPSAMSCCWAKCNALMQGPHAKRHGGVLMRELSKSRNVTSQSCSNASHRMAKEAGM